MAEHTQSRGAFGCRLKALRENHGLSQKAFAALGGVSKNSQLQYEQGATAASIDYILCLEAAGIGVASLLARTSHSSGPVAEQAADPTLTGQQRAEIRAVVTNLLPTILAETGYLPASGMGPRADGAQSFIAGSR
jgi:transcriptional regulator with XRE-family HTH domain